jgi:hypothetical protein
MFQDFAGLPGLSFSSCKIIPFRQQQPVLGESLMIADRKNSAGILVAIAGICVVIIIIVLAVMITGEDTGTLLITTMHISFID